MRLHQFGGPRFVLLLDRADDRPMLAAYRERARATAETDLPARL